jgi:hypothetical protein
VEQNRTEQWVAFLAGKGREEMREGRIGKLPPPAPIADLLVWAVLLQNLLGCVSCGSLPGPFRNWPT